MIRTITLENFRNFERFETDFSPVTLITGPNGAGKTSLLESIALLGGHRFVSKLQEMIQWGATYSRIEAGVDNDTYSKLSMLIQAKTLRVFGDDAGLRLRDVYRRVPSVYFSPRAVSLLEDAPSMRRRFLDQLLITLLPEYEESLSVYAQTLRQRNAALAHRDSVQQSVWEEVLAVQGAFLILARNWCTRELSGALGFDGLVHYHMSPKSGDDLLPTVGSLTENVASMRRELQYFLQEKWRTLREKELQVGFTLMGPQRDDWAIMQQRKQSRELINVGIFGSRGEQRIAVIALQHAALDLLARMLPTKPLWILDDVFSELDKQNHRQIISIFDTYQTFVSAATMEYSGVSELLARSEVKHIALNE